jgi:hypothetical protein
MKMYYLGPTLSIRGTMMALLSGQRLIDTATKMFLSLEKDCLLYYEVGDPCCTGHYYDASLYGWHKFKEVEE